MSSPGRFSAELVASGVIGGSQPEIVRLRRHIETAVKFALPPNGEFFSSDLFKSHDFRGLKGLDELRLPFPAIVMEFAMLQGDRYHDAIVSAVESHGGLLLNICLRDERAPHGWNVARGDYFFDFSIQLLNGEPRHQFDFWKSMFPGELDDRDKDYVRDMWEAAPNVVLPLLSLVEVLQCSNVRAERVEVPAPLAKKRARRGEPSFAYHVLTIPGGNGSEHDGRGGSHAAPRQHLRRGHIRRLPDGRKIWINACVVGRREDGEVEKDYRVAITNGSIT